MATPDESGTPASKTDIESDIENTRAELGQTVDALASKLDVKGRAQDAASDAKEKAKEKVTKTAQHSKDTVVSTSHTVAAGARENKVPVSALIVAAVAAVGLAWWWRRR